MSLQRHPAVGQLPADAGVGKGQERVGARVVGWFDGRADLVGAGLVLYRQLPKIKRYLAYLPEGPVIDWPPTISATGWSRWPRTCKRQGAFGVRIGAPVVARRWRAETIKAAIADERVTPAQRGMPDVINHQATRTRNRCAASAGGRRMTTRASPPASRGLCSSSRSRPRRRSSCWPG